MGKSLLLVLVCAACANNVPQDRSTGPDGKIAGAKELTLAENEVITHGVVTYPGGDRVDWKKITLPEKARGKLAVQVTYTTPRPNLRVTFDVFDQWHTPVTKAAMSRSRNQAVSIPNAKGTYYVRVFAPRRGDAGTYKLSASFEPQEPGRGVDMTQVAVADPPRLPAVPDPDPDCLVAFDATNPVCADKCPPGAPKNHKGCIKVDPNAPTPPVVVTPPTPPVEVKPTKPVVARVMSREIQGDGSIVVIIGAGSDHGVSKEWTKGSLLRGDTRDGKAKLPGATLTIMQVDKRTTRAKLRAGVTSDVLKENSNVVLEP